MKWDEITLKKLKVAKEHEIKAIPINFLRDVMTNFKVRFEQNVTENEGHLQDVVFISKECSKNYFMLYITAKIC